MLQFLQATCATDTVGCAAGWATVSVFFLAVPYAPVPVLLPIVIGINLVRRSMGLADLGAD